MLKKFIWSVLTFYDEKKIDGNSTDDTKEDYRHKKCFLNNIVNQRIKVWYDLWHPFVWNRKINHSKILVMSCSCDHALFLQCENENFFIIRYKGAFWGMWECIFMGKYAFHKFFLNRLIQKSHTFKKPRDTIVYIECRYRHWRKLNKITNKLQKSILIVHYVRESSNLSFSLFTQRESSIVEDLLLIFENSVWIRRFF